MYCVYELTFQRNVLPPSSGSNISRQGTGVLAGDYAILTQHQVGGPAREENV